MELSPELIAPYKNGQLEVQNLVEKYLYRGEIKDIAIEYGRLQVQFNWLASGVGYPPIPTHWEVSDPRTYDIDLSLVRVSDIGDNRLCLTTPLNEIVVLFPSDGSKLNPNKVCGLKL